MHAWEYREAGRGERGRGGGGGQREGGKEGAGRQGERRGQNGREGEKGRQRHEILAKNISETYCSLSGSSKVLSAYSHTCDVPNDPIKAHHAGTGECRCNAEHKDSTNEAAQDETK